MLQKDPMLATDCFRLLGAILGERIAATSTGMLSAVSSSDEPQVKVGRFTYPLAPPAIPSSPPLPSGTGHPSPVRRWHCPYPIRSLTHVSPNLRLAGMSPPHPHPNLHLICSLISRELQPILSSIA